MDTHREKHGDAHGDTLGDRTQPEERRRVARRAYRPHQRLVTVSGGQGPGVHLAWSEGSTLASTCLCGVPSAATQAAGAFLDLGCDECAALAADLGLYVATDDDGAAVSVRAFLRRTR